MIKQLFISLYIRFKGRDAAKNRAIKKAKKLHLESGYNKYDRKHYRVYFLKNKYEVLTRSDLQLKKHSGEFGWQVNSTSMKPFCFYDTATDKVYSRLKTV
jgi:hypothetical protein